MTDTIFERVREKKWARSYVKGAFFFKMKEEELSAELNCDIEQAEADEERNREINRLLVENQIAMRPGSEGAWLRSGIYRATYANEMAQRIYEDLPEEKSAFRAIVGFYYVVRANLERLFWFKRALLLVFGVLAYSFLYLPFADGNLAIYGGLQALAFGLFFLVNAGMISIYHETTRAARVTLQKYLSDRVSRLESCEQAALSGMQREGSIGSDDEWKRMAPLLAYAARAFRWRIFFIKQFLDIASHKMVRRHVWVNQFGWIVTIGVFVAFLVLFGAGLMTFGMATVSFLTAHFVGGNGGVKGEGVIFAATFLAMWITSFWLWDARVQDLVTAIANGAKFERAGEIISLEDLVGDFVGRLGREREARRKTG
ncbi:MAG: hypothetical protein AAFX08_07410 [Pseudomonadota bacterium]